MSNNISLHGYERAKERTNVNGALKTGERAKKAWERGKEIDDFESLKYRKYLKNVLEAKGGEGKTLRVFGNEIYIFTISGRLITVLNIPAKLQTMYGKGGKKNARVICDEEESAI